MLMLANDNVKRKLSRRMDPKIRARWVRALRSGKYKQGEGSLCRVDSFGNKNFCCLGVLCDIYAKDHKKKWKGEDELALEGLKETSLLPEKVAKWAGLTRPDPIVEITVKNADILRDSVDALGNPITAARLAELNDDHGLDFHQIADLISASL